MLIYLRIFKIVLHLGKTVKKEILKTKIYNYEQIL